MIAGLDRSQFHGIESGFFISDVEKVSRNQDSFVVQTKINRKKIPSRNRKRNLVKEGKILN